uniref:Uncharacterized protein n=1 Tax=Arundo donax TaxID=35708 RepID=A0A0A8ZFG5_ARUDO
MHQSEPIPQRRSGHGPTCTRKHARRRQALAHPWPIPASESWSARTGSPRGPRSAASGTAQRPPRTRRAARGPARA